MIKKKRQKLTDYTFPYLYISCRPAGLSFSRPPALGGRRRRRRIGKERVLLMMRGRKKDR